MKSNPEPHETSEMAPIIVQTRELKITNAIHTLLHVTAGMTPFTYSGESFKEAKLSNQGQLYVEKTVMNTCHKLDLLVDALVEASLSTETDELIQEGLAVQKKFAKARLEVVEEMKRPSHLKRVKPRQIKPGLWFASCESSFTTDNPPVFGLGTTPEKALQAFDEAYTTGQQPLCDLSVIFADSPLARVLDNRDPDSPITPAPEDPDSSDDEDFEQSTK